jgi:hypothetical protein
MSIIACSDVATAELACCDAEIAQAKAALAAGHPEIEGLCLAVADWAENKRLIEAEMLKEAEPNDDPVYIA